MTELSIQLHWQRAERDLQSGKYSNAHTVQFNDRYDLPVTPPLTGVAIRPRPTPNRRWPRRCPVVT